jgi:ABC-type ATPase involved in cell division
MMTQRNPTIAVRDFGPIHDADVQVRPLTIFIGPNSSGKTYLARLMYALSMALSTEGASSPISRDLWPGYFEESQLGPHRGLPQTSEHVRTHIRSVLDEVGEQIPSSLMRSLSNYFGYERLGRLATIQSGANSSTIRLNSNEDRQDGLSLELTIRQDSSIGVGFSWPEESSIEVPEDEERLGLSTSSPSLRTMAAQSVIPRILLRSGLPAFGALYLPAGRSGLVTGAQAVATSALSLIDRVPTLSPSELGPFTGIERDFVRVLIERVPADINLLLRPGWSPNLAMALVLLETELMKGVVLVRRSEAGVPTIVFEETNLRLPLQQSSSMVAELSPLALWLKALLGRGDLLIFDEPEAHLHPENQRLIARLLVRLVNAGIRVLVTTHSSLILHQISNCMMASRLDESDLINTDLQSPDRIRFDQVAAYLFTNELIGTVVSPLMIDPEFGIAEDEFLRVAESIGEETYRLAAARHEERLVGA